MPASGCMDRKQMPGRREPMVRGGAGFAFCTCAGPLLALVFSPTPASAAAWKVSFGRCTFMGETSGAPLARIGQCNSESGVLLDLSNKGITSLPDGVFDYLEQLTSLSLYGNELSELRGDEFSGLPALEFLSLADNKFLNIPEDLFSGLSALQELHLDGNYLYSLRAGAALFSGLTNLRILRLCSNQLSSLPVAVFSHLSALETLTLSNNLLGASFGQNALPSGVFSGLSSLRTLILSNNQLYELRDDAFFGLSSLRTLYLYDNMLKTLPADVFSVLSTLEIIDLTSNKLTSLPAGVFSGLNALGSLSLPVNELQCVPLSAKARAALTVYEGPECACEDLSCRSGSAPTQVMLNMATPTPKKTPAFMNVVPADSPYFVVFFVAMPYTKSEFDPQKQSTFKQAMGTAADTSPLNIDIMSITAGRRRAGSVDVETKVRAEDATGVKTLESALGRSGTLTETFNREVTKLGLREATRVAPDKSVSAAEAQSLSGGAIAGIAAGGAVLGVVMLVVSALYLVKIHRNKRNNNLDTFTVSASLVFDNFGTPWNTDQQTKPSIDPGNIFKRKTTEEETPAVLNPSLVHTERHWGRPTSTDGNPCLMLGPDQGFVVLDENFDWIFDDYSDYFLDNEEMKKGAAEAPLTLPWMCSNCNKQHPAKWVVCPENPTILRPQPAPVEEKTPIFSPSARTLVPTRKLGIERSFTKMTSSAKKSPAKKGTPRPPV